MELIVRYRHEQGMMTEATRDGNDDDDDGMGEGWNNTKLLNVTKDDDEKDAKKLM